MDEMGDLKLGGRYKKGKLLGEGAFGKVFDGKLSKKIFIGLKMSFSAWSKNKSTNSFIAKDVWTGEEVALKIVILCNCRNQTEQDIRKFFTKPNFWNCSKAKAFRNWKEQLLRETITLWSCRDWAILLKISLTKCVIASSHSRLSSWLLCSVWRELNMCSLVTICIETLSQITF